MSHIQVKEKNESPASAEPDSQFLSNFDFTMEENSNEAENFLQHDDKQPAEFEGQEWRQSRRVESPWEHGYVGIKGQPKQGVCLNERGKRIIRKRGTGFVIRHSTN